MYSTHYNQTSNIRPLPRPRSGIRGLVLRNRGGNHFPPPQKFFKKGVSYLLNHFVSVNNMKVGECLLMFSQRANKHNFTSGRCIIKLEGLWMTKTD